MLKLIRVKNYTYLWQAELAKNILAQSGIACILQRGNSAAGAHYTALGDIDLIVTKADYLRTKEILDDYGI